MKKDFIDTFGVYVDGIDKNVTQSRNEEFLYYVK